MDHVPALKFVVALVDMRGYARASRYAKLKGQHDAKDSGYGTVACAGW
jgi:hypothetical protein